MIELKNIKKVYRPNKTEVHALRGVSLTFEESGLVFILGKSGSGKSTLLNILGGLDTQTSGELTADGAVVDKKSLDEYRRQKISFIYQDFQLLEDLNVLDNLALATDVVGERATKEQLETALASVGLDGLSERKATELSGGQMQRVAIARGVLKPDAVLLADEPTGNLDEETGEGIFELLQQISKKKLVIIVSHDKEAALKYADRIVRIADGAIVEDTKPAVANKSEEKPKILLTKKQRKDFLQRQSFVYRAGHLAEKGLNKVALWLRDGVAGCIDIGKLLNACSPTRKSVAVKFKQRWHAPDVFGK